MSRPERCVSPGPRAYVWGGVAVVLAATAGLCGCGGDARVEIAAATSIDRITVGLRTAIDEYHRSVDELDDRREDAIVDALVQRIRRDHDDETATERHVAEFRQADRRLRSDRAVEWQRYAASVENVSVLGEVTSGLRRLAVESLTLSDEARRCLTGLIDTYRHAEAPPSVPSE